MELVRTRFHGSMIFHSFHLRFSGMIHPIQQSRQTPCCTCIDVSSWPIHVMGIALSLRDPGVTQTRPGCGGARLCK
jgi:hypothetical protein